ncbi:hypothetical protein LJC19_07005 [Oxalobacter sp. OttesenSCG-928-P03]|nr:hypothetical protein [Oxalobacter sp. OttesenSCG-928-P03]
MRKFKVWLDSGANIHSCHEQTVSLDELNISSEEWDAMSEDAQEDIMREIAFNWSEWGWCEIE